MLRHIVNVEPGVINVVQRVVLIQLLGVIDPKLVRLPGYVEEIGEIRGLFLVLLWVDNGDVVCEIAPLNSPTAYHIKLAHRVLVLKVLLIINLMIKTLPNIPVPGLCFNYKFIIILVDIIES